MLKIEHLNYQYESNLPILKDISLNVAEGEKVGLLGCNGSGKSTLLSLICGLLLPQSGEIHIDDIAVTAENLPSIREKLGVIFQNPDEQLFMPTIFEDVAFGPRNYGYAPDIIAKKTEKALQMLNIEHLRNRPPYRLSGGEKRNATIAAVMVMEPKIILLDEPSVFLDRRSKRNLINTLQSLDAAMLLATHDFELLQQVCSKAIVLYHGQIAYSGDLSNLIDNEELLLSLGL